MTHNLRACFVVVLGAAGLVSCTAAQQAELVAVLSTPPGQLFCALEKNGATTVVGLIDAEASALVPGSTPVAVLATGALKATVDAECAAAAVSAGAASGIAVSPPANPAAVPQLAIITPAAPPAG